MGTPFSILENLPRDELFQATDQDLERISVGILHLQDRQRTAVFCALTSSHGLSPCWSYVPRDRFDTDLRLESRLF